MSELPTNIASTYPDASAGDTAHQGHHDQIHAAVNSLDALVARVQALEDAPPPEGGGASITFPRKLNANQAGFYQDLEEEDGTGLGFKVQLTENDIWNPFLTAWGDIGPVIELDEVGGGVTMLQSGLYKCSVYGMIASTGDDSSWALRLYSEELNRNLLEVAVSSAGVAVGQPVSVELASLHWTSAGTVPKFSAMSFGPYIDTIGLTAGDKLTIFMTGPSDMTGWYECDFQPVLLVD